MRDDVQKAAQALLARMMLPEVTELIRMAADDIELRTMQTAGDGFYHEVIEIQEENGDFVH